MYSIIITEIEFIQILNGIKPRIVKRKNCSTQQNYRPFDKNFNEVLIYVLTIILNVHVGYVHDVVVERGAHAHVWKPLRVVKHHVARITTNAAAAPIVPFFGDFLKKTKRKCLMQERRRTVTHSVVIHTVIILSAKSIVKNITFIM